MLKRLRRRKYLIAGLLVVAAALTVNASRNRRPQVRVARAHVGPLTLPIAASGLVESDSADLGFQVAGRVAEIYVREGDRIGRTQVLARFSTVLTPPDSLGVADVIQSPYDGTVVTVYQRVGALVIPGQPVIRVISSEPPWVTAFVESEDAVYLRPGHKLTCRAGGYLSQPWELEVVSVGAQAVARPDLPGSSRQVRVRCTVTAPAFALAAGTEVDIDGEVPLLHSALLIPAAAVMRQGPRQSVWLLEGGRVTQRDVQIGANNFEYVAVQKGLAEGDTVVVNGKQGLQDGQRVRATPMPPMVTSRQGDGQ